MKKKTGKRKSSLESFTLAMFASLVTYIFERLFWTDTEKYEWFDLKDVASTARASGSVKETPR
jgi:hypothetical protein